MKIHALDLTLTAAGWAGPEGSGALARPSSAVRGLNPLAWIRDRVVALAEGADLIVTEGYSYGHAREASRQHVQSELGGVVRLALHETAIATVEVPPVSLKRYGIGKGNALNADAWWLRAMPKTTCMGSRPARHSEPWSGLTPGGSP